jgi:uroporphyrinogen decarboxylase
MMRQAGRYLPEYRALRERPAVSSTSASRRTCGGSDLAADPRFGFDAAILFSDILVVPHALGRARRFVAGEGPRLDPLRMPQRSPDCGPKLDHAALEAGLRDRRPVRGEILPENVTLLGLLRRALDGCDLHDGRPRARPTRRRRGCWPTGIPKRSSDLIDILVEASAQYLVGQFKAGVDAVQIFDTWAECMPPEEFDAGASTPTRRIVARCARRSGAKDHRFSARRGRRWAMSIRDRVDAVGLDWMVDLDNGRDAFLRRSSRCRAISIRWRCVAGGEALDRAVDAMLERFAAGR